MYIKVRVVAKAKKEVVENVSDDTFKIWVKEPALMNRANIRVRTILAGYYDVSPKEVKIVSGHHSPSKIFAISRE